MFRVCENSYLRTNIKIMRFVWKKAGRLAQKRSVLCFLVTDIPRQFYYGIFIRKLVGTTLLAVGICHNFFGHNFNHCFVALFKKNTL